MSLLKTTAVQIGQSITPSNNFVWYQPTVPDGTLRVGVGNHGETTDVITFSSDGSVNFAGTATFQGGVDLGQVDIIGTSISAGTLRIFEDTDNGTNYVALKSPASVIANITFTLPSVDGSSGQYLKTDGAGNLSFATVDALPSQSGNSGKYLTTNGSAASWSTIDLLPSQTGNSGKYLATNGTTTSWETISVGISTVDDTSTDTSYYPALFTATSGSQTAARVSSTKLYFNPSTGALNATEFNSLSDATQKTNVTKVQNATATLNKIDGVEFDWTANGKHSAGVVAQKLEEVLPFLVDTNENGIKSVNYSGLIAYLIQSNKELVARVEALENK